MHAKSKAPLTALLAVVTAVYASTATFAQGPATAASSARDHVSADTTPSGTLNSRQFEIPFSVDQFGARPLEVQLFVSRDHGRNWSLFARQAASGREFQFTAPDDGTYWFATRTIDAAGNAHPAGRHIAPQLRVTVDTTRPELSIQAEAYAAGRVILDYAYVDDSSAAGQIHLQYMTDTNRTEWFTATVGEHPTSRDDDGTIRGRIDFTPEGNWRYLQVRLTATDPAGNQAVATKQVEMPRVAGTRAHLASAPQNRQPASALSAGEQRSAAEFPSASDGGYQLRMPDPVAAAPHHAAHADAQPAPPQLSDASAHAVAAGPLLPRQIINPYVGSSAGSPRPAYRGFGSPSASAAEDHPSWPGVGVQPISQPSGTPHGLAAPAVSGAGSAEEARARKLAHDLAAPAAPISPSSAMRPLDIETLPTPAGERDDPRPVNTSATPRPAPPASSAPPATSERESSQRPPSVRVPGDPAPGERAPSRVDESEVRQSRSRQFSLDYEVESVGSKGIQAVELWGSNDDGRSWSNWGSDPDNQSPFDIETQNSGLYGFRIVVVGGNGLTSPRPQPGDEADIYVRVDTEAPRVGLTAARYGEGDEAGSLIIEYRCEEENLASRPISLSFGESPDGPWTTIATGLENTGRYAWPADPRLPRQIYLRIEAVDRAGNVGNENRDTPVAVQGLAPRARIRGFQPIAP